LEPNQAGSPAESGKMLNQKMRLGIILILIGIGLPLVSYPLTRDPRVYRFDSHTTLYYPVSHEPNRRLILREERRHVEDLPGKDLSAAAIAALVTGIRKGSNQKQEVVDTTEISIRYSTILATGLIFILIGTGILWIEKGSQPNPTA